MTYARSILLAVALLCLGVPHSAQGSAAAAASVTVGDSYYDPEALVVEVGSTVTWTQEGNLPHSVTADDNSFDSHPGCAVGAPGCMQNGHTFSRAFTQPGLVPYYCKIHGGAGGNGMSGVVQVVNEQGVLPTTVDTMTASAGTGTISIAGSAALGGEGPVVLGQDGLGDAVGGPAATALGLDMDKLLISRPSGSSSSLLFTIKLGGMATGGIPETILYNWDINVDGGATGAGGSWSIKTMRSRAGNTGNADPYAGIFTCVPGTTGFSCTQTTSLSEVAYDQVKNEIRMSIPLAAIGAKAGSRIEAWPRATNPFWIGPSASGAQTLTNVFDTGTHEQYLVPSPTVHLGIAPAGEPVAYTTGGSITNSGAFSGTLPAPVDPGAYDVGAKVCFGTNCGTRSVRVTL